MQEEEAPQHQPLLVPADAPAAAAAAPATHVEGWGHALDWLLEEQEQGEERSKDAPVTPPSVPPSAFTGASTQSSSGATPVAAAGAPSSSWDAAPEAPVDAEGAAGLDPQPSDEGPAAAAVVLPPATATPDDDLDMLADVFFPPQVPQAGRGASQAGGNDWRSPGSSAEERAWLDASSAPLGGGAAVGSWFSGPRVALPLSPASAAAAWRSSAPLQQQQQQESWGAAARRRAQQPPFGDDAYASTPTSRLSPPPGSPSLRTPPLLLSPHRAAAVAAAGASPSLILARSASLRTLPVSVRPASLLQLHSPGGLRREASQRSLLASPSLMRLGSSGREAVAAPAAPWRATGYSDAFVDEILDVERRGDETVAAPPPLASTVEDRWVSHPCGIPIGEHTAGLGGGSRSSSSSSSVPPSQSSLWNPASEAVPQWQTLAARTATTRAAA